MKKRVTFADIAKYTGFSKTTISRYFNNPDSLTLENQEIIQKTLKDLNYQENKLGKILASGQSEFIGILIPNLYLNYYAEMLDLILASYEKYGFKFIVFPGNSSPEADRKYIHELLAYQIEGLIVLSPSLPSQELAELNIPVVAIEREAKAISSVDTDNAVGGRLAAKRLLEDKCDHYIHINVDVDPEAPSYQRITSFEDYLKEHGQKALIYKFEGGSSYHELQENFKLVFEEIESRFDKDTIKGVFLANDTYANLFLNQIIRKYGHLPDTYKLIGFDGTAASAEAIVGITTVAQKKEEMIEKAMGILLEQIHQSKQRRPQNTNAPVHIQVDPVLIGRQTA
ncbi:LacI family DNA-binding transcriptional regulator [Erysipelotrichaceae bacterium 51-3]